MKIQWQGSGLRIIHGYTFQPGQMIEVPDEEIALDILTQPNEPFERIVEVETESKQSKPESRKKGAE